MSELATAIHPQDAAPARWRVLRSIGAVLAGLLANIVLVGAIETGLRAIGMFPALFQPMADHQWAIALVNRVVFAVVGGLLTAWLAPAGPMRHVMVLGGIETVLSVLAVLISWNKGPGFGPHWFAISVIITALPCAALGGMLYAKRIAARINEQRPSVE